MSRDLDVNARTLRFPSLHAPAMGGSRACLPRSQASAAPRRSFEHLSEWTTHGGSVAHRRLWFHPPGLHMEKIVPVSRTAPGLHPWPGPTPLRGNAWGFRGPDGPPVAGLWRFSCGPERARTAVLVSPSAHVDLHYTAWYCAVVWSYFRLHFDRRSYGRAEGSGPASRGL
jgi:hypothetical protein